MGKRDKIEELKKRKKDLEKLNTIITMENERLINEMKKLEKDNQTLMNSIVTEAHTKETKEIKRLNNIIKKVEECIEHYAIENEDFSKFYNNEEIEILKIIGSDKE